MSLRKNILANYASQIYVTAAGIVMVPLYIKYMGPEAYGLVGFFAMLQAWFNLLDMGLTPTMARESARFNGGATSTVEYRQVVRAMEGIFSFIALLGGAFLFFLAESIGKQWLHAEHLPSQEIETSLQLIAIIIALRWMCGIYRGIISGSERLVWLSGFNSIIASGRFVLVLPILIFISASPAFFFGFQLCVALVEFGGLAFMAYRLLPTVPIGSIIHWRWAPLRPVLKFSLSIAFTSSVWVLVTQTDKLVLSKVLPLAEYGYFTVAVLVASGIMMVSGPISSSLLPRMTRLHAEGLNANLIDLYRQATQLVTATTIPAAFVLIFFAPQVLWAWTGDAALVQRAGPALRLYAIGYAFLAVGAFPYYLQYAKGNLRLHLIGNIVFILLLIPSIIVATSKYGMEGAGWAWLISNMLYFCLWTPLVHKKFAPGIHKKWLTKDILLPLALPFITAILAEKYIQWSEARITLSAQLIAIGIVMLVLAYSLSSRLRFSSRTSNGI